VPSKLPAHSAKKNHAPQHQEKPPTAVPRETTKHSANKTSNHNSNKNKQHQRQQEWQWQCQ